MLSLSCSPVPENPVSDEPIESVKNAFGNAFIQTSLTGRLKIAALLAIATRELPSKLPASYASISGRAIASPVMKISWTFSRSMIRQVSSASNVGSRIVRCPANRCISIAAWAPPCISGLSGKVTIGSVVLAFFDWVELLDPVTGHEVDAAAEDPPEVLVAPHDALGEAGRAAGVDDVEVVATARTEVALGALAGQRLVPGDPAERRDVGLIVEVGRVGHRHDRGERGVLAARWRRPGRRTGARAGAPPCRSSR